MTYSTTALVLSNNYTESGPGVRFSSLVPCEEVGCNAPYNRGCENMYGEAVCICPECDQDVPPVPVCSSDGVQDRSKCMVERQSCLVGKEIEIAQGGPCGTLTLVTRSFIAISFNPFTPKLKKKYILQQLKEKNDVGRIGCNIIFHLNKL